MLIPVKEFPEINFFGLIVEAHGNSSKGVVQRVVFNGKEGRSKAHPDCMSAKLGENVTWGQPNQEVV